MCGQPGHNTRPHVRSPPSFLAMDAWVSSQLNVHVPLIRKLRGSLMCMPYCVWYAIHGWLYNQSCADVRASDAIIKGLYCTCTCMDAYIHTYMNTYMNAYMYMHKYKQGIRRGLVVMMPGSQAWALRFEYPLAPHASGFIYSLHKRAALWRTVYTTSATEIPLATKSEENEFFPGVMFLFRHDLT